MHVWGCLDSALEAMWFLKDNRQYKPVSHRGDPDLCCTESVLMNRKYER